MSVLGTVNISNMDDTPVSMYMLVNKMKTVIKNIVVILQLMKENTWKLEKTEIDKYFAMPTLVFTINYVELEKYCLNYSIDFKRKHLSFFSLLGWNSQVSSPFISNCSLIRRKTHEPLVYKVNSSPGTQAEVVNITYHLILLTRGARDRIWDFLHIKQMFYNWATTPSQDNVQWNPSHIYSEASPMMFNGA